MSPQKTILALDPGFARTGFAVLKKNNDKIITLDFGCIETKVGMQLEIRLLQIYNHLEKLIKKHNPKALAVEKLFFNTNQKTAIQVSQAQGVMLLAASKNKLPVYFLTPLEIKLSLTGYGVADKNQVQSMVMAILNLKKAPKLDDTADAMACGIAFLSQNQDLK